MTTEEIRAALARLDGVVGAAAVKKARARELELEANQVAREVCETLKAQMNALLDGTLYEIDWDFTGGIHLRKRGDA